MSKKSQVEKARATADSESDMANRLRYFAERQNEVTETMRQLVEKDPTTANEEAVMHRSTLSARQHECGVKHPILHHAQSCGDYLQDDIRRQRSGKEMLLL